MYFDVSITIINASHLGYIVYTVMGFNLMLSLNRRDKHIMFDIHELLLLNRSSELTIHCSRQMVVGAFH
jgi:hypothetical protein